ncbi:alpha/beta fold hydrolase [Cryomorpha ignava]|uniref:Alpha/beta fold hydrolase n=1 Tax=Cryomorpha ignava TaxID=101383 RepID=A0A7K3WM78_9FLAO|nr:alpha/beta fold hydrolase [Cryomorpha ignava]NEN21992.1 alpha/beta fold hydrolase [Cryomorpha ignava]
MKLAFKKMGEGEPLVILHGLFGSSDNWQTLGRQFAEDFTVYLVDQRNHGHSPHSEAFSYEIMANDLKEFFVDHEISQATVIGHSMGGKTAMRFAQLHPEKVEKLIVVDMGIKTYTSDHEDVLAAFHALDLPNLESRKDAEVEMEAIIPNFTVRQFLLKNLYRKTKTEFAWRVNFPVLEEKMDEILAALPGNVVEKPSLFIYGEKSNYIKEEDFDALRKIFPKAKFAALPTGHWVHAEDAEGFYKIVMESVTPGKQPA